MSPQLEELWLEHAIAGFEKQIRFTAMLGAHQWLWDGESGELSLRRDAAPDEMLRFATQALGSESLMTGVWTWIWANEQADLPENLTRAACELRKIGKARGVPELAQGEFSLTQANGHTLSLLAAALLGADAYYCGDYLGGTGFLLIEAGQLPAATPNAGEIARLVSQALDTLQISNHRHAVTAYLRPLGWQTTESNAEIVATSGAQRITAKFDESNRLIEIGSTLQGAA